MRSSGICRIERNYLANRAVWARNPRMRTLTSALLVLSFVVAGVAACSSDESSPAPVGKGGSGGATDGGGGAAGSTAGSGGTGTGGTSTGGTAGGATGGTAGTAGSGGGTDQCVNAKDEAALQGTYTVGDASGVPITGVAAACGKSCLGKADLQKCTTDCIVTTTGGAISEGCAGCVAGSVTCIVLNCLGNASWTRPPRLALRVSAARTTAASIASTCMRRAPAFPTRCVRRQTRRRTLLLRTLLSRMHPQMSRPVSNSA